MTEKSEPPPGWLREEARNLYGEDPLAYEASRPEYPERVYDVLRSRCGLGSDCRVVEIGPGTGRVTRRLLEAGASVVAIEPDTALVRHLANGLPDNRLKIVSASFEEAELATGRFDLIVAAASFHWVDQHTGLPKVGSVLRPGGWVAFWWTIFGDPERPDPFHDSVRDLLGEGTGPTGTPDAPQFELDADDRTRDLERKAGLVDASAEMIHWTARMTPEEVRGLYASMIRVLRRPRQEQLELLQAVERTAKNNFAGVVDRPFVTALYTARRP
jgi:SAM-dependent methyltransferase